MLKRKITKITKALKNLLKMGKNPKKLLTCKVCDKVEVEVAADISAVTCAYCVQRQVAPPPNIKPKEVGEKFPRGWALRSRYVHTDGRVFSKGKETGETETPPEPKQSRQKKISSKTKTVKKIVAKKSDKPKRRK